MIKTFFRNYLLNVCHIILMDVMIVMCNKKSKNKKDSIIDLTKNILIIIIMC